MALAPFVAMAVTYGLALLLGYRAREVAREVTSASGRGSLLPPPDFSGGGPWVVAALLVAVAAATAFFWPVWTAEVTTFEQWQWRMWLPSWI